MPERSVEQKSRLPFLDSLRGFALVLMTFFHFSFDLTMYGALHVDFRAWFWQGLRILIVTLFVALSGVGFSLGGRSYGMRAYYLRLLRIAAAAGFFSLATYVMDPQRWVYFGILHFFVAASLLAPFFAKAPRLALPLGIFLMIVPEFFRSPWFDRPFLQLTGLAPGEPNALDFVPLLPWFGVVLLGIFAGSQLRARRPAFLGKGLAPLSFLGRHSLVYYVVHQMALLPIAWLLTRYR